MNALIYQDIPKFRLLAGHAGLRVAEQELAVAKREEDDSGRARWALVVFGGIVLYLALSVARTWGPTGLAAVLPVALFGLTRAIYRASALSLR